MEKVLPKLRFPEFQENWDKKKIGDIGDVKMCKRIFSEETTPNGEIPFYKIGSFGKVADAFITRELFENYKNRFSYPKIGDTLISASGTIGRTVVYNGEEAYYQDSNIVWVENNNTLVSNEFFYYILQLVKFNTEGGTIQRLYNSILKSTKFNCPKELIEQQKIATFLTSVDERLTLLVQQKEKLELYKKGVMQQIFSQKLRFKDENGKNYSDWEEKKLGEIGNTFNGLTGKTKEHFGNGKPYIQYMQIFNGSKININDFGFVEIGENENQSKVQYGDVFFTTSSETPNEIGTTSILLNEVVEVYLNSFCFGFRPNSLNELVPEFAQFLFRSKQMRDKIVPLAQGSTRFNMSKVELMKIDLLLPCEEEQQKIASFLSAIDVQIEGVSKKIAQTKLFKKGLLQQMFV